MKKNTMLRIASVLLVAVLLSTCGISGTFAKYTASSTQTATASVAKWDIKLQNAAITNSFTFNLFETILDTDVNDTEADDEVATGKIAPGTKGECTIILKNDSEVDAKFKIDFTVNATPLTVTYKIGNESYTSGTEVNLDMGQTVTVTVSWEWPFEGNDNNYGNGSTTFTVKADVSVEQRN